MIYKILMARSGYVITCWKKTKGMKSIAIKCKSFKKRIDAPFKQFCEPLRG